MPNYVPLAISYSQGGLVNDKAAFNLTDDSFQLLENAFNFRGRIRRRAGYTLLGRLRRDLSMQNLGNTTGGGTFNGNIITILGLEAGAQIESGSITITVGAETFTEPATPDGTLVGDIAGTGTINYATGALTLTGTAAATAVVITFGYFPMLPCMGLRPYETSTINQEQLIAFDTRYAYRYNIVTNQFEQLAAATWTTPTGGNSDFFYTSNVLIAGTTNYLFFVTNFVAGDNIQYFDGTNWNVFTPDIDSGATEQLRGARIIVQYRGRVVVLNTREGAGNPGTQYPQRARWSQIGTPLAANAWYSDVAGRGGFIDCPTSESIVSAEFVRDTLIVGFERSTWKLRYTGNELTPFVWERINRELGCESTFSTVPFDKGVLAIGDKSINVCDGNSVEPIDQNIPDEVFKIHNGNDGPFRVYGVRDFYNRYVYWTFPDAATDPTFPDRLLAYDYESGAWAIFTDSFTCFGPWQRATDIRWADLTTITWNTYNDPWNNAEIQSQFPDIAAGNQQGYTFIFNPRGKPANLGGPSTGRNDNSLQITAITAGSPGVLTVPNHNMQSNEFVRIANIIGNGSVLNGNVYKINRLTANTFSLLKRNPLTGLFTDVTIAAGTYLGLGEIERVFNMRVRSKKFNLMGQGSRGLFGYIDFLAETTEDGQVGCEIRTDYEDSTPINPETDPAGAGQFYNTFFVTTRNPTFNIEGSSNWQRFYCPVAAQFFDFTLTFTDRQMVDANIQKEPVVIEAFLVWLSKDGRLVK